MSWFTENVDGAALATALTAICSLLVAFVHRRGRGDRDDEAPRVMQGQAVDAPLTLESYLKSRNAELEAEVTAERAGKERAWRQRDAAYSLLRANGIPVPDPDL
ncbi:hypothetical protein GCM10025865_01330 [Paraoerskovia sediminicola]|uniref:Uncharacterized protein n=1 Tax=Paraoerskovia sediminicola TaxID=1138587 RepID=A0ABN6X809_9CELL|nr:hypothetical protein [Paraoerskovia sediminicola]BDZ40834.1 hypothetical protein GCM10025865_01330 [Paraoerskovia sediminicola]